MAEAKGVLVKGAILHLKERYGEQAVSVAMNALNPEDRDLLPPVLLDSNWYPFTVWRAMSRLTRYLEPGATSDTSIEVGRTMARYAFTGVYKSLLVKDPVKQAEKFPWINDLLYKDTRKVDVEIPNNTSCIVIYRYEAGVNPRRSTCLSSMGLFIGLLELAGANKVKFAHTKCMIDRKDFCESTFEWS